MFHGGLLFISKGSIMKKAGKIYTYRTRRETNDQTEYRIHRKQSRKPQKVTELLKRSRN